MFVRNFSLEIDKAMDQNNDEKVMALINEAMQYYIEKVNGAFCAIHEGDLPYIICAIDIFRTAILKDMKPDIREELEETVSFLHSIGNVNVIKNRIYGSVTEEAAKEIYKRDRKEYT